MILNLLSNAVKYSPESDFVQVKLSQDDDCAYIEVKDTGIGISKEHQIKVFDRFYRVNQTNGQTFFGQGLGLYIASEIVRRHDGTLSVKSQKRKGYTFKIALPIIVKKTPHRPKITSKRSKTEGFQVLTV